MVGGKGTLKEKFTGAGDEGGAHWPAHQPTPPMHQEEGPERSNLKKSYSRTRFIKILYKSWVQKITGS